MADTVSLLIEGAVAAGTLSLAVIAYYQIRLSLRERNANQGRELVEKIYLPLRNEASSWLDPDTFGFGAWPQIEKAIPHLSYSVPTELVKIFREAEPLMLRLGSLNFDIQQLILKATGSMIAKMGLQGKVVGSGHAAFSVRRGIGNYLFAFYLQELWLSDKSLNDYSTQKVEARWPGLDDWTVDLLIDGQPVGGLAEAQELAKGALEFLVHPPPAREFKEKIGRKRTLAGLAMGIIDERIRKLTGIRKPSRWAKLRTRFRRKAS
jgi:hypothetical protein